MWDYDDIKKCVSFYNDNDINFSLLLTNSTYPAPYETISLKFIDKLKN